MLLEFDADQRLWQETVRDVVAKQCPPSLVRSVAEEGADTSALWKVYADLGWTELNDPASAVELAIVTEELGRATDPTAFLATMTQFAPLVGERFDPQAPGAAVYSGVAVRRDAQGWMLDGTARHVLDGDRAERLAVVTDAAVFVVSAGDVFVRRSSIFDPVLHVADVTFDGVHLPDAARVSVDTERARHVALTGMAMTMVGACQRILDLVLDHVRGRQQFGVPIGSFQAVQHKAADMHVAIERARALGYFAALTIAEDDPRRRLAAAMAKAAAGECQALVFRHGLQLFGAMGFTWENDLQFALKRAKAGELMLGGAAEHRAMIAEEYRAARI
ncbi:acyl-CoA dehydrogenase family protein [Mycobacterium shimoidei]|uniref:Acyl-CoA dehydrogenase domain-containing protein [Frankia sp. EAN1pec] n=1 Tax=Mycobacterium shimoidei TaxID=29313 RepID=A0A1E3SWN0_MYCSH|nr:acyl-CoA dehydrogenase family protein [Mycobacterium shimoidei]MCV7261111.1 acyl-CoA dehydrogenase family protein [Mycobacterium shimoidei]ODR06557.1 acyl-CoA dehydrogenase [Mycobacterium shimoidei]ORW83038.1 acyl-CoA dehydrogenase [Mycobacterium shimoidei]SRX93709.1 acyl-CoA dehydrogenase domain-containing protein [Frankia sp. EAN1pec] [Mycobacterium shimoidei]